jgi:hypothetical protein
MIFLSGPRNKPSLLSRILAPLLAIATLVAGFFFFTFVLVVLAVVALAAAIWWMVSGRKRFAQFKQSVNAHQFEDVKAPGARREGQIIEGEVVRRE